MVRDNPRTVDLVAVGVILVDHLFLVSELPPPGFGGLIKASGVFLGGRAPNVAVMGNSLGLTTAIVSVAGADFSKLGYYEFLSGLDIDLQALDLMPADATDTSFIFTAPDQRQITFVQLNSSEAWANKTMPESLLRRCKTVHISSGDPAFNRGLANLAHVCGTTISFDVGNDSYLHSADYLDAVISVADFVFMSRVEAEYLRENLRHSTLSKLAEHYNRALFVVFEETGAVHVQQGPDIRTYEPIGGPDVVDRTGASDGLVAGFLAATLRGLNLDERVRAGQLYSRQVTSSLGCLTTLNSWEWLERRLQAQTKED